MLWFPRRRVRYRILVPLIFLCFVGFFRWWYSSIAFLTQNNYEYSSLFSLPFNFEETPFESESHSHFISSRQMRINTAEMYPHLDFIDSFYPRQRWEFWNKTFEERYRKIKETWKELPLHVIIIPHSHVDPGWLGTFDEYYNVHVESILNNMVTFLNKTPDFTFIWSEISFLSVWWNKINESTKQNFRNLVKNRQLEITTGGWVMTDEATTHYWSILDQLIEGHQWLKREIGNVPSHAWSVDVFGHSSIMPLILTSAGFQSMVTLRTHYAWKLFLAYTRNLDFYWETNDGEILCHMAPSDLYSFKHVCGPNFKTCLEFDFRKIEGEYSESLATDISFENVRPKVEKLLGEYGRYASLFPHNVLLVPLGDDFRYNQNLEWEQQYQNYIRLFSYINKHPELNARVQFGTLSDYFDKVIERLDKSIDLSSVNGDFLPYADVYVSSVPSYWTGFYSTRPFLKGLSRELEHWLRATEILYSLARSFIQEIDKKRYDSEYPYLINARQNLALIQHHDAITGTCRQTVEYDYIRKLHISIKETMGIAAHSAQYIMMKTRDNNTPWTSQIYPDVLRTDAEELTQKVVIPVSDTGRIILIFNSLAKRVQNIVKIRVKSPHMYVFDEIGNKIKSQVNPVWSSSLGMMSNIFEVIFVCDVNPLAFAMYKLIRVAKEKWDQSLAAKISLHIDDRNQFSAVSSHFSFSFMQKPPLVVDTPTIRATFTKNGLLKELYHKYNQIKKKVEVNYFTYTSRERRSGAYLFEPTELQPLPLTNLTEVFPLARIVQGPLITEITFTQKPGISLTTRLFNYDNAPSYIEMESFTDMSQWKLNYELILRITSDIENGNYFYTDANGLNMMKREKIPKLRVAGNYYPATSATYIEDNSARLHLFMDHSHGVSSPSSGILEVMLDRRIKHDDNRGMGEGVINNRPTISKFRLLLENFSENKDLSKLAHIALLTLHYPIIPFATEYSSDTEFALPTKVFATKDWPVHLVNLRTLSSDVDKMVPSNNSLMVILHTNIKHHDIDVKNIQSYLNIHIASISETSLTGVRDIKTNITNQWRTFRTFNLTL